MKQSAWSRRNLIKAGMAAVAGVGATSRAKPKPAVSPSLTIGLSTLGFRDFTNRDLADLLNQQGIRTIQLFFSQKDSNVWKYNHVSDISGFTPDRVRGIADAYRSAGVTIHSIGVYANLIHPDPAECKANLDYFDRMMALGRHMGVNTFISEAGHFHPEGPAPRVPFHFEEAVWGQMVEIGKQLAERARAHDAKVLLEPFFRGFLASAKRTRLFLEAIGSARVRALLDPANLLEVNDLNEMFTQLGPWIDCLHAKDRKLHVDRGVGAGQGDLDYPTFVELAARYTPHAPMILEYVGPKDYQSALEHLRKAMRAKGIAEQ